MMPDPNVRPTRAAATALAIALVATLAAGCERPDTGGGATTASASVGFGGPTLARIRGLDAGAVDVELRLDGSPVLTRASADGAYLASFTLPDDAGDGAGVVIATWTYDLDGTSVTLARSVPVAVTPDSPLDFTIDRYDTRFDADTDGVSNLDELLVGADPLDADDRGVPPPVPDADTPDCRTYPREGFPPPIALPELVRLRTDTLESYAVAPNTAEGNVYYGAFLPEVFGNLRIEHTGGTPEDTDAIIHLRRPFGERPSRDPARFDLVLYDTREFPPDGRRAVVPPPPSTSIAVNASFVYCFVLFTRDGDGSPGGTPLRDTVIEVEFVPDPDRVRSRTAPRVE